MRSRRVNALRDFFVFRLMFCSGFLSVNFVAMGVFIASLASNLTRRNSVKKQILSFLASALVAAGVLGISDYVSVVAQDSGKPVKTEKKDDGAKKTAKSVDRLPANYAKIGVSDDQRKKIYEIQNKYDKDIAALQKQLADIKAKELAEVEAVLTPEQKKSLETANEESKKKAAEKKKAGEKSSEKTAK